MTVRLHHHQGLGDHIICNALVREIRKRTPDSEEVFLACKPWNLRNVKYMFQDIDVKVYEPYFDDEPGNLGWMFGGDTSLPFDQAFYKQVEIPFEKRWSEFKVRRDLKNESELVSYLNLPKKFALAHSSGSRGAVRIQTDLPIIRLHDNPVENTIFSWIRVIELATEIHCINSSFIHLVESVGASCRLYFYDYRPKDQFTRRLDWISMPL